MIPRCVLPLLLATAACASVLPREVPEEAPPLADMEVCLLAAEEPGDEAARQALDHGSFSGLVVESARASLDDIEPSGLRVVEVVENSPADVAGIEPDDILFSAVADGGAETDLAWPSQWRELELETRPGSTLVVHYDRAGLEREARLLLIPRVRPPGREEVLRYRETQKVGVVLRTATEVEARGAGLGPGAGAVVIGLSRASPWRRAGILYGDLLTSVGGRRVDHPQVVLDAIREAGLELEIGWRREGEERSARAPVTRREKEVKQAYVPLLYDYEREGDRSEMSLLLGLFGYTRTAVAARYRILWLITFTRGEADRLVEEETP